MSVDLGPCFIPSLRTFMRGIYTKNRSELRHVHTKNDKDKNNNIFNYIFAQLCAEPFAEALDNR